MKNTVLLFLFVIISIFLSSCSVITGEEIGRLSINKVSSDNQNMIIEEVSIQLKKDQEIALWSDMDIEYEESVGLLFKIEISKGDSIIGVLEIDPTDKNRTLGEVKTSIMGKTEWSFSGKNKKMKMEEDALYAFKGILIASENASLKINKAEIVIKK